jgi:hypothetical protein
MRSFGKSPCAGTFCEPPAQRPFQVRVVNKEHPITQGIHNFVENDEQHFVTYDKDPKYVLLESENIDGLEYEQYGKKSWVPSYFEPQKRAVSGC